MDFFEKIDQKPKEDLSWNIPEKKQGTVNVIGGNREAFKTEIKVAEFLSQNYPIENVNLVLPIALEKQLPPLPNFKFLTSTDTGSFANAKEITDSLNQADFNLMLGDLSKNSVTKDAISTACQNSEKPLLITRDSVDLITSCQPEKALMNDRIIIFASMAQLQKLFRAVYYPKMLLLSQSLIQVAEALHKFTLSYPVSIITLHNEQILIAQNGLVKAVPLAKSGYTPINIWNGELAAKIVALNLYNPNNLINTTIYAFFS